MRKGLFIGINHYTYVSPLSGCNNDAMAMASVLERHANGRPNFSSKVLTSAEENLTHTNLKQQIQSLFSGDCDVALLYFALCYSVSLYARGLERKLNVAHR